MKIAIYGQSADKISKNIFLELLSISKSENIILLIEKKYNSILLHKSEISHTHKLFSTYEDLDSTVDLMITIGGDGTLLRSITFVRDLGIPIIGINTGRLGFLATLNQELLNVELKKILKGEFKIEERSLLEVRVNNNDDFSDFNFALNEVSVGRKNTTSMIEIKTTLNGEYLNTYWADGLIVSTPTGSTGYSLSCGGPIMTPSSQTFSITPIAPHNLNARPLVISDEIKIELSVEGREETHLLSLDSRINSLKNNVKIKIKKANYKIKLASFQNNSFYKTLRSKLLWGEDRRNI
ncbi:MAG: NAD kinase [Flavobacteriaceae bacterium]|jgi:NAD+ kinase|nr:NAD kinase [Flavobacteriaceae bacterium]MDA8640931.1 NAD kinase [Flavobacteriaceae bacterium]MDC1316910.1 NAD kinase [Flavobacteriaceae bacterium]MDG1967786.1 NAD kinase [Flavobacteriaceae bacterium]|tara:strand:+ start:1522 stop:2406 length:885 start_codon:yes stop_codon:yes gene_type:complete